MPGPARAGPCPSGPGAGWGLPQPPTAPREGRECCQPPPAPSAIASCSSPPCALGASSPWCPLSTASEPRGVKGRRAGATWEHAVGVPGRWLGARPARAQFAAWRGPTTRRCRASTHPGRLGELIASQAGSCHGVPPRPSARPASRTGRAASKHTNRGPWGLCSTPGPPARVEAALGVHAGGGARREPLQGVARGAGGVVAPLPLLRPRVVLLRPELLRVGYLRHAARCSCGGAGEAGVGGPI